ncbi:Trimethylguanosine synthase [Taenia solium]|eukprot:TsM_000478000 transcript=TsM_000478000 gene=TsM_000478000
MAFDMNHIKELVCITYSSTFNKLPTRLYFTRAFFADCFKGMPAESCVSFDDKQSLPSPLAADSVSEGTKPPSIFVKSSTSVRCKSAKVSPKYYNSLAYTLSVLRNGESDSDDSDSESSSSLSLQSKQDRRPEWVVPQVQVSKSSPKSEDQGDVESILEEMRMLGLPTSFGHSKFSGIRTVATRHQQEQDQSTTDLDALFLNSLENDKGFQYLTHSLTDISKASLSSERRCIFRYKPPSAASSRKYVNQKPPPEHLYEDGETVSSVEKYWAQRYRLFSRFDSGIQFDRGQLLYC